MKLPNQKAKVPFLLFFFDRNQPMTQPSAGKKQHEMELTSEGVAAIPLTYLS